MSSWDVRNKAHFRLWIFERYRLKNKSGSFETDGEEWGVNYLTGYVPGAGTNFKAQAHAILIDEIMIDLYHSEYENGVNQGKAISDMASILSAESNKLGDFGVVVDALYKVKGEI